MEEQTKENTQKGSFRFFKILITQSIAVALLLLFFLALKFLSQKEFHSAKLWHDEYILDETAPFEVENV